MTHKYPCGADVTDDRAQLASDNHNKGVHMRFTAISRRRFMSAAAAALVAMPLAGAWAASFTSERITVRTEGNGPDVILIPGLSSSPRVWAGAVKAVPGYRYHLVQLSGFAGQPAGANKEGDVAAPAAEEIARYIREAGLRQPAVVGHSMGGSIGMMLAARHPESLSRLMVVDMWPWLGIAIGGPRATRASLQAMADQYVANARTQTPEQRKERAAAMINGYVNTPSERPGPTEDMLASDPEVSSHAFRELLLTDLGPELPHITVPVTVLYAPPKGMDPQFGGYYKAAYAPLKQAVLKPVPDSAHFIMLDQPAVFQAELKSFLEGR